MTTIGTPLSTSSKKALLCGSGELGKEVAIELMRYGVEVISVDSYPNAPAMQVAHRSHICSMLDAEKLKEIIQTEKPHFIIPEVEAIATDTLIEMEKENFRVVPTARATKLTMNREGIRRLAAEEIKLKTSPYRFAESEEEFYKAVEDIKIPCVIKPIMSSSGKGQSYIRKKEDIAKAWTYAQEGARGGAGKVIIEGFVDFDYEITLLTVRHINGVSFCAPIGHRQESGDYRESWQPQPMSNTALENAQKMAADITEALGGFGLFGVEFFVKGDDVIFSEVSPRPHDTGMVTMISQNLSEFALHARAILGLPIPTIRQYGFAASAVITAHGTSNNVSFENIDQALTNPDTEIRLFGKPEVNGERRMGVALALGSSIENAREKATFAANQVNVITK